MPMPKLQPYLEKIKTTKQSFKLPWVCEKWYEKFMFLYGGISIMITIFIIIALLLK